MRVAPVGWAFDTLEQTKAEARRSAEVTHNHSEGIKGAETAAVAIWLARHGSSKDEIRQVISETTAMISHEPATKFARRIGSTKAVRKPSPKPSPPSSTQMTSRARSDSP